MAMVRGPSAGLELLETLDADRRLNGHHRLDAVRAHLLEIAGNHTAAIAHYRTAAGRTTNIPERNYLIAQAARLAEGAKEDSSSQARRSLPPGRRPVGDRAYRRRASVLNVGARREARGPLLSNAAQGVPPSGGWFAGLRLEES
jgi:hypothetical protein